MARHLARVPINTSLILLTIAVALLRPGAAVAQSKLPAYEVTGFRDTRFGMTEPEVRQVVKTSFGIDDDDMTSMAADRITGATRLLVHVHSLDFGFGEPVIEYLFGYRQHRLFKVDVVWGRDRNPQFTDAAMIAGAMRLQGYFLRFAWADRSVRIGVPLDERAVVLFSAEDRKGGGAVSVAAENVRYELRPNNAVNLIPEHMISPRLIVSYTDQSSEADVQQVGRGEF